MTTDFHVSVRSDLYEGEMTEDGERRTEESFYIIVEDLDGQTPRSCRCWRRSSGSTPVGRST